MKLYLKYIAVHIKGELEYKKSFVLMCIGQFISPFLLFTGMLIFFQRFGNIKGYTVYEVSLFYSMSYLSYAVFKLIGKGLDNFPNTIRRGELDRLLLRPRSVCFQVIASKFDLNKIGGLAQGIIVFIYAISNLNINFSFWDYVTMLSMIIGGNFIFIGLHFIGAAMSFKTIEGLEIINIFTHGGRDTCQYPLTIYRKEFQKFFTYVIPFAFMNYIPINVILGKSPGNEIFYAFVPLVGVLFVIPCYLLWKLGMKYYGSTGS